jgi:hypothetical protein
MAYNGWVFVSGFALHNAQFKGQILMAKLAQIPCYLLVAVHQQKAQYEATNLFLFNFFKGGFYFVNNFIW